MLGWGGRPRLECCTQVWSPHLNKEAVEMEKAERRKRAFRLRCFPSPGKRASGLTGPSATPLGARSSGAESYLVSMKGGLVTTMKCECHSATQLKSKRAPRTLGIQGFQPESVSSRQSPAGQAVIEIQRYPELNTKAGQSNWHRLVAEERLSMSRGQSLIPQHFQICGK